MQKPVLIIEKKMTDAFKHEQKYIKKDYSTNCRTNFCFHLKYNIIVKKALL